jgi:hypothetical protein
MKAHKVVEVKLCYDWMGDLFGPVVSPDMLTGIGTISVQSLSYIY